MKKTLKTFALAVSLLGLFSTHAHAQNTVPDITVNKTIGCAPEAFTFSAVNIPSGRNLVWVIGGDTLKNGAEKQTYLFTNSGSYDVELFVLDNGRTEDHIVRKRLVNLGKPNENITLHAGRIRLCDGPDTVSFQAAATGVQQWDWIIDGTNYINAGSKVTHRFTTPGVKKIVIRTKDSSGCYALKTFDSVVTVIAPPAIDFSANITSGCVPLRVDFTPNVRAGSSPIVSYSWNLAGSNMKNGSFSAPFSATYDSPGSYDVYLFVTTKDGCSYTIVKKGFINPGRVVAPSFTVNEENTCSKSVYTFTNTSAVVQGQQFTWSFPGGTVLPNSSDSIQYVRYVQSGTYSVTLTAKSGNCSRDFIYQVPVNLTNVSAEFYSDMECGCRVPDTITFIPVLDSSLQGQASYQWSFYNADGDLISQSQSTRPHVVFNEFGTYDAALKITMPSGCSDYVYKKGMLVFKPLDTANLVVRPGVGCKGETFNFSVPPVSACDDKGLTYEWTYYDKDTNHVISKQTGSESKVKFNQTGQYGIKLTVKSASGCVITRQIPDAVTVIEPDAHMSIDSVYGCMEGTVTLRHHANHPALKFNYRWELTNVEDPSIIIRGDGEVFRPAFPVPGAYDVNYTATYVGACNEKFDQKARIFVSGAQGDFSTERSSGCLPFTANIQSRILKNIHYNNDDTTIRYVWSASPDNGISFSDIHAANPEVTITRADCYTVILKITNSTGCNTIITKKDFFCIGVHASFGTPDKVCSNDAVIPDNGSYNAASYKWSVTPEAKVIGANTARPVITFPKTGAYVIKLVVYSKDGCADSITRTIVSEKPVASFTSKDTVNYCAPAYVSFTASHVAADSFYWSFGDGETLVTADTSIAHIYKTNSGDLSTGFDVTLVVKSKLGCTDTLVRKKYIKVVGPVPAFDMKNTKGCEPLKVQFTNKSRFTERWYLDYGDKSRIDTLTFGPQVYVVRNEDAEFSVYKPRLLAKGEFGCTAWADAKDSIVVYRLPKAGFTVSSGTGCWPYKVKFTDTSKLSYKQYWDFNNDGKVDATGSNPEVVLAPGTHTVKLVVENRFGCRDSIVVKNAVTIYPNIASSIKSIDTVCAGNTATFSLVSDNENLVSSYRWTVDGKAADTTWKNRDLSAYFSAPGKHRIEVTVLSITGCEKNVSKTIFVPDTTEIRPEIEYVTVEDDSTIRVVWTRPNVPHLAAQMLERLNDPSAMVYSSADMSANTFTDKDVNVNKQSYTYGLQNRDVCGNVSGTDKHSSIWLSAKAEGKNSLRITWTGYKGWASLQAYRVYRLGNEGTFTLLAQLTGTDTTYVDEHLCDKSYGYRVEAVSPDAAYSSRSNTGFGKPVYEPVKKGENVVVATVVNDARINITWSQNYAYAQRYSIDRYEPRLGWRENFATATGNTYQDANVDVHHSSYAYRVHLANECGDLSNAGTIGKSILLQATVKNEKVYMAWNRYDYWKEGVAQYQVELKLNDGSWKMIHVNSGTDTSFIDEDIHEEVRGTYTYRVTAIENGGNSQKSLSNQVTAILPSHLYVPNVFTPNKDITNDVFIPKAFAIREKGYDGKDNYSFSIYNRWGERVFETNNLEEGWDGTFKGKPCQEETYIYIINAMGYDNQFYYLKGSFTLMK